MVHELSRHHSIFNQFLAELRDADIQKDPMRFRQNLQRIGQILALEVSKVSVAINALTPFERSSKL